MTKPKTTGKTLAKAAPAALAAVPAAEFAEFPDALGFINSLASTREGIEWDCRVYKVENAGRGVKESQPFLFNVDLEDLPTLESALADSYPAGGAFRVAVRADNQLVKNIKLEIAARPGFVPPPPSYLSPVRVAPVAPTEAPGADRMESFFVRMAEMQERSAQQTRDLIASIAARPAAPPAPTMMEQIQLFTQIQALMPKGAQENTLQMFEKGFDLATKLFESRGGESGGASWLDVIKEAIASPIFKDALGALAVAAQQPVNGGPMPPGMQPAPPSLVSPANPAAVNAIDTLIRQAQAGVDPKFVAQQVANNLPAGLMDELEAQDDVVSYLIARFPQVGNHRAWFAALVAEIWEEGESPAPSPTMADPNAGRSTSV